MRAFAQAWPEDADRQAMQRTLSVPEPERAAGEFSRLLRLRAPVAAAWHVTRMRQVAGAIEEWATRHRVTVDYVVEAPRPRREQSPSPARRVSVNEEQLRALLVQAVQRMPLADLLRLPVPAEFLLEF
jgi:hypothetical protein